MAISLGLNRLPWYGQVGAFIALSAAVVGVFWNWYARPAYDSLAVRQTQLRALQLDVANARATARRLPQFRAQIASLEAQLERLRAVLPEERDVADLLRRVQGMATQSNLAILGFKPQAVAKRQTHMEWPIGLQLEGRYHDLGAFLERISKFQRVINVGDLEIKAIERDPHGATIVAECTATTFVLIDNPPQAPAPGAPGAGRSARAE